MKPREEAIRLVQRYYRESDLLAEDLSWLQAKECALIAVDEISRTVLSPTLGDHWQKIREEIEKL